MVLIARLVKLGLKFCYERNFEIQAFRKEQCVKQKPAYNEYMKCLYTCVLAYYAFLKQCIIRLILILMHQFMTLTFCIFM